MIGDAVRAGKVFQRVHVVREPLTDYLRYEFGWSYPPYVEAGEDIRILVAQAGSWPMSARGEILCGHRPARLGRSSEAVYGPRPDVTFHPAEGDTAQVCGWQAGTMRRPADGRNARPDRLAHHAAKRGGRHVRIRRHVRAGGHVSR